MGSYVGFVMALNVMVNLLLLMGTNCYLGFSAQGKRALPAALLCGVYSAVCLLDVPDWVTSAIIRVTVLTVGAVMTYGISRSAIRRTAAFVLISLFIAAITSGFVKIGYVEAVAALACSTVLFSLRSERLQSNFVTMELTHNEKKMRVVALNDTGNGLRDPITGESVVVVNAEVANAFTGLTKKQLSEPVESLHLFPGLRLIPYRSVGKDSGFLLALRFSNVRIGRNSGSYLVAFAPEGLSSEGRFQALTGRTI